MSTPDYSLLQSVTDPKARSALRKIVEKIAAVETQLADLPDAAPVGLTTADVQRLITSRLASRGLLSPTLPTGAPAGPTPTPTPVPPPAGPIPTPIGPTRGDTRCFVDNGGKFLGFGATCFWGAWGFVNERDRLGQNLECLKDGGVQYVRLLGTVGGAAWAGREINSTLAGYAETIAACTDWIWGSYGLRTQWTLIGSTDYVPDAASQSALMTTFKSLGVGREHKIFLMETCNEPFSKLTLAQLRNLTNTLQTGNPILVAAGSSQNANNNPAYGMSAIYGGGIGTVVTAHFDRNQTLEGGVWRPMRQSWDAHFWGGVPVLTSSNEPIGPESSGSADEDPRRLAMDAATCYLVGVGSYVLHTGAGVGGGGSAPVSAGRKANYWEYPTLPAIFTAMRNVRTILPVDIPNWTKHNTNAGFPGRPLGVTPDDGNEGPATSNLGTRIYQAENGSRFAASAVALQGDQIIVARRNLGNVQVWDVVSGLAIQTVANFPTGATLTIPSTIGGGCLVTGNYV